LDRNPYPTWEKKGSLSTADQAELKLQKILKQHQPLPLPPEAWTRFEHILAAAEAREQKAAG
jgi:trimethylamine:corrinoid methyltransferase-like protein